MRSIKQKNILIFFRINITLMLNGRISTKYEIFGYGVCMNGISIHLRLLYIHDYHSLNQVRW